MNFGSEADSRLSSYSIFLINVMLDSNSTDFFSTNINASNALPFSDQPGGAFLSSLIHPFSFDYYLKFNNHFFFSLMQVTALVVNSLIESSIHNL